VESNAMNPGFSSAEVKSKITLTELRRLLIGLKEHQQDTGFRFRLFGELWHPSFMSVIAVGNDTVLLLLESCNKLISVDLAFIIQFEIDLRFQEFMPNFHYDVAPLV
jgi:hypothetical protein